jgi:hypothetical protein
MKVQSSKFKVQSSKFKTKKFEVLEFTSLDAFSAGDTPGRALNQERWPRCELLTSNSSF